VSSKGGQGRVCRGKDWRGEVRKASAVEDWSGRIRNGEASIGRVRLGEHGFGQDRCALVWKGGRGAPRTGALR
jgi:hypothetical protein